MAGSKKSRHTDPWTNASKNRSSIPLASIALRRRLNADRAWLRSRWKKTPLANTGHQLQSSHGQPQTFVQWCQPSLEICGSDNLVRQSVSERFQADATVVHDVYSLNGVAHYVVLSTEYYVRQRKLEDTTHSHPGKPAKCLSSARIPLILLDFAGFQWSSVMNTKSNRTSFAALSNDTNCGLRWFGVIFGLVFPMIITWGYFIFASSYVSSVQQATYLVVKCVQFAFPLVWVLLVLRGPLRFRPPTIQGLVLGAAFGVAVVGAGWFLFDLVLEDTAGFAAAVPRIRDKIAQFGIKSVWTYAALGLFYSLIHSLLEEYYWRWFVFGQLRKLVPLWPAIIVSALGFMGHHVILLSEFFKEAPWLAWLLSSLVAVGGVFWAWLYERTGSIYSTWLSHLLIDAGIFWIGYDLVRDRPLQ